MRLQLQVLTLPVADVDRSLAFYRDQAGFGLDVDYAPNPRLRVVQMTPPGSSASIQFGVAVTDAPHGSARATYLVVGDVLAAHEQLRSGRVAVTAVVHKRSVATWQGDTAPGVDPQRRDYASFFDFADPDGNTWRVQEVGATALSLIEEL